VARYGVSAHEDPRLVLWRLTYVRHVEFNISAAEHPTGRKAVGDRPPPHLPDHLPVPDEPVQKGIRGAPRRRY
jgi:hypothetical protein